mgnify:CR=1 FL=1
MRYNIVYYELPNLQKPTKWHEDMVEADYVTATTDDHTLRFWKDRGKEGGRGLLVAAYTEWHHFRELPDDR